MNDISTAFHEYFEIVIADTPVLLKEAFSIRYQMLCVNKCMPGFDADNYHDKLEQDEFDSCSLHLLLRHRSSNSFIGTTRLILSGSLGNDKKLPIELYTQFYPANTNMNLPRQQSIEISRFIILNSFLRRKGDNYFMMDKNAELLEGSGRRRFPHPMLGLAIGIIQTCAIHNIYHLFSIMDPALNRLFGFYGMQFYPIGPLVSYHGLRRPFYVCLIDVLERMYENHRDIWELMTNNGKVWPENLEYYKSICGPRQNVSNTDISIINC